jgi:hypothetical protein
MSGEGSREDLLAEGILGILGPAVEHVDQKIADVRKSQADLRQQVDQLADGSPSETGPSVASM